MGQPGSYFFLLKVNIQAQMYGMERKIGDYLTDSLTDRQFNLLKE